MPSRVVCFEAAVLWTQGIPVVGAILVSPGLDRCLLVRGWGTQASWGFPRGKINEHEPDAACAAREVRGGRWSIEGSGSGPGQQRLGIGWGLSPRQEQRARA